VGTFTALPEFSDRRRASEIFFKTDRLSVASLVNYHVFRQPNTLVHSPFADE
jgi:hypothetical protein